jgi:hypothetical protein
VASHFIRKIIYNSNPIVSAIFLSLAQTCVWQLKMNNRSQFLMKNTIYFMMSKLSCNKNRLELSTEILVCFDVEMLLLSSSHKIFVNYSVKDIFNTLRNFIRMVCLSILEKNIFSIYCERARQILEVNKLTTMI